MNELEKVKSLCKYYNDNLRKKYTKIAKNIKKEFMNVFNDTIIIDINYRIKEKDSLYEKIIRKNCVSKINSFITNDQYEDFIIENENTDDIIGIIILANLSIYDKKIYDILLKSKSDFEKRKLFLDISEKSEKSIMNNKFEFYKFKGKYTYEGTNYRFELQIKSQIYSLWSNLEHKQFYKDYSFYHEKENNKQIVTDVGRILLKIEDLLFTVLDTKDNHDKLYYP